MTRRLAAAAAAAYCALTVAITWPLVLRLSSTVPHDLGDPLLSTSILWWNAHVMPLTERWWNGFAFFPARGMIAFSDHRLGESLLASPIQWIGFSPVVAYNVTLLATFPLSALAAHWLGYTLTRRHDAAVLCGLGFGFNPYRMAHLEHLELLASFALPAALTTLHLFLTTHRRRWLAAFSLTLVIAGLCTSYYLAFFSVLLLLWVLWFIRWRDRYALIAILAAAACAAAILSPIALGYWRIHQAYDLRRDFFVVSTMGGDLTSLATASNLLALWRWTSTFNGPERQLFPGLTLTILALAGMAVAWRQSVRPRDKGDVVALVLVAVSCLFGVIAASLARYGPWRLQWGPVTIAGGPYFKPISVALFLLVIAGAVSSRVREAWHRKSVLAFYAVATGVLFLCALGPTPRVFGRQFLYEPPYAWLMRLPVFGTEIRVPARFAMMAVLALAASAAAAFNRLQLQPRSRRLAALVLAAGMVLDAWPAQIPLPDLPDTFASAKADGFDAVLELPIDNGFADAAAMYHAMFHRRPVVNAISGYFPPHYLPLAFALDEGDYSALDGIASSGRLLLVVDRRTDPDGHWRSVLESYPGATHLRDDGPRAFFALHPPPSPSTCRSSMVPIAGASDGDGPVGAGWMLLDGNPLTIWGSPDKQRAGAFVVLDLGRVVRPCAVSIMLGREPYQFPRALSIATSLDGSTWTTGFNGPLSSFVIRAAIATPRDPVIELPLLNEPARYVRLRLEASHPSANWVMADVGVRVLENQ